VPKWIPPFFSRLTKFSALIAPLQSIDHATYTQPL
jgi:hypothetical protein